jgi:hypothetical protein
MNNDLARFGFDGSADDAKWREAVEKLLVALVSNPNLLVGDVNSVVSGDQSTSGKRVTIQKRGRYTVSTNKGKERLYVNPGSVALVDLLDPSGLVTPIHPTLNDDPLDEPRWFDFSELDTGKDYSVVLVLNEDEPTVELREAESLAEESSDEDEASILEIAQFHCGFDGAGNVIEDLVQLWESDVIWPKSESSSSSSLSSESSSEASSEASSSVGSEEGSSVGSDEDSSIGSDGGSSGGSDGGSDKSTAIVPASWSKHGYTALFTEEAPDVRFHDVMQVKITGRVTWAEMDPRYVEVCAEGAIWVQGVAADRPFPVGVRVCGGEIRIECGRWRRPGEVTVSLTGIRKGFVNLRFPDKTRAEFEANERFLNMNKPRK